MTQGVLCKSCRLSRNTKEMFMAFEMEKDTALKYVTCQITENEILDLS
jgi:hypothetical protein